MTTAFGNRISFTTPTTGTGTISIGAPILGFQLPPPSIASGSTVGYTITDGVNWEVGTGVYTTGSPPTLSRANVEDSSSGAHVLQNLSGTATVSFITTSALYAAFASHDTATFSVSPTAPTAPAGTNTTQIATTAFVGPAFNDIGRNKVQNSMFNIQQRGTGPWTTSTNYTADRWELLFNGDTDSVSVVTLTDADRTAIGDEEATYCLQNVFTGVNAAADYSSVWQGIEGVRRLANRNVVVSFWAKAVSGTPKIGVSLDQYFGTGGSPSATVTGSGSAFTLSTTWTRYSSLFVTGSLTGKTLGSNNNDYTQLNFWFSAGANFATRSGSIGAQTSTISLWGVQLELGPPTMSPFEKPDAALDLATCQRYYQIGNFTRNGYIASGVVDTPPILFPVAMRASPTVACAFSTQTNCTGAASPLAASVSASGFAPEATGSSTAAFSLVGSFTATADY
jgi:hypothetical protein